MKANGIEGKYIEYKGKPLGQYGANAEVEPPILPFDENAARYIKNVFEDTTAIVYTVTTEN